MALDLHKPAETVAILSPAYADLLNNLQANILISHGRDYARLMFLRFVDDAPAARTWIQARLAPMVTTARQHYDQVAAWRAKRQDGGTVRGFFLSAKGYEFLDFKTDGFKSKAYRKGMKNQGSSAIEHVLGATDKDPKPSTWDAPYQQEIHALITIADDKPDRLNAAVESMNALLSGVAEVLRIEEGITLRWNAPEGEAGAPIEHFGYVDGVSNPLFTKEDITSGHREGHRYNAAPMAQLLVTDPLTKTADAYGTYFVFRKLRQNVLLFETQIRALSLALHVSEDLAGAMVVGRFKDGTPLTTANAPQGVARLIPNTFDYAKDEDGLKCPFHAHIRKLNPRDGTPLRSHEKNDTTRITRRGIPYGKPTPGLDATVEGDPDRAADRGLLFMCCQASVDDQFEFLQQSWADNPHFPKSIVPILLPDTGDDPLIGQDAGEPQHWPKSWGDKKAGTKTFNFESAVTLRGGEYFFAPSLPFLRSLG